MDLTLLSLSIKVFELELEFPQSVSVCLSVCLSVSVSVSLCLCLCLSLSLLLPPSPSLPLSLPDLCLSPDPCVTKSHHSNLAFQEVGGFRGLLDKYPQAVPTNVSAIVVNTTCHWPDRQAFRMLRDVDDDYMPWLGFLLGQTPGSIWYWCADQVGHGPSGSGVLTR